MRYTLFLLLALVLLHGAIVFSDVLCLIEINSQRDLEIVRDNVDRAHGMIDGKFIIIIDDSQKEVLNTAGIMPSIISRSFVKEDLYLIGTKNDGLYRPPMELNPLYEKNNFSLCELNRSELDILKKSRFSIIAVDDLQTPFFYHPLFYPAPMPDSFATDTLADLVNQDSLYSYTLRLQNFQTRYFATDSIIAAGNWLMEKFIDFGYLDENVYLTSFIVTDDDHEVYNQTCYNVICVKPGTEQPEKVIIIGAHYDSINRDPPGSMVWAPGANDNASGTAAVLEMARIYNQFDFKKTLVFVLFSAEEIGRHGSMYMADSLYENGIDVEVMVNLDCLGNTKFADPGVRFAAWQTPGYFDIACAAADRVADLVGKYKYYALASDDYSFMLHGFYNLGINEDIPLTTNIHKSTDIVDSMLFDYMSRIVRSATAIIPIIDLAVGVSPVVTVQDYGDGQTLRVEWNECVPEYDYTIVYGDSLWFLGNTIDVVEPTDCHFNLSGLEEGKKYYVSVIGAPAGGVGPLGLLVDSARPYFLPLPPQDLDTELDSGIIILNWHLNEEYDFSHYKIIHKVDDNPWQVLTDNYLDTGFIDDNAVNYVYNDYIVLAVDNDGNTSDSTSQSTAIPPTFDLGILLVDETQIGGINPGDYEQTVFFNGIFDTLEYDRIYIDSSDHRLNRSLAGQYNPIFWIDDDDLSKFLEGSIDSLKWFLNQNTDFLLAGWSTIYSITGQKYFYPGSFYYDKLGISYIAQNSLADFTGANGAGNWPTLELKPDAPNAGRLTNIDIFTAAPGAEVIYTYNAYSPGSPYDGKPVGIAYDTYYGKRVILGFPLYWMTEASAQAMITRVMEYFAEESVLYGDVNGDWAVNILDVTYLINYLYMGGPTPADLNNGDPNGDCSTNILDITYLISYLYKNGPAPIDGCVI